MSGKVDLIRGMADQPDPHGPVCPGQSRVKEASKPNLEDVELLRQHFEGIPTDKWDCEVTRNVVYAFLNRQTTEHYLYPPAQSIKITYSGELPYFHIPWRVAYKIMLLEAQMGKPMFFGKCYFCTTLSIPDRIDVKSLMDKKSDDPLTFRPHQWIANPITIQLEGIRVDRRTHALTGAQVVNFLQSATRMIRMDLPEQVRKMIALRIRMYEPIDSVGKSDNYRALKNAMTAKESLPFGDFEVYRCLCLGILPNTIKDYLKKTDTEWYELDLLAGARDINGQYSVQGPKGQLVPVTFLSVIPTVTRKVIKCLNSYNSGHGYPSKGTVKRGIDSDNLDNPLRPGKKPRTNPPKTRLCFRRKSINDWRMRLQPRRKRSPI